jgi:hypothetical protein
MREKEKLDKIIDELYSYYESENSLQIIRYVHPMYYNGTFSENNSYQPPKPDELMTKDEFIQKMNSEGEEYRWSTAFQVLYNYISKQKEFRGDF